MLSPFPPNDSYIPLLTKEEKHFFPLMHAKLLSNDAAVLPPNVLTCDKTASIFIYDRLWVVLTSLIVQKLDDCIRHALVSF